MNRELGTETNNNSSLELEHLQLDDIWFNLMLQDIEIQLLNVFQSEMIDEPNTETMNASTSEVERLQSNDSFHLQEIDRLRNAEKSLQAWVQQKTLEVSEEFCRKNEEIERLKISQLTLNQELVQSCLEKSVLKQKLTQSSLKNRKLQIEVKELIIYIKSNPNINQKLFHVWMEEFGPQTSEADDVQ